jgi:oligoendopeptidase F
LLRFDYRPEDCLAFGEAIEKAVVPAAERIYQRRRKMLGVEKLRPWDLSVDPAGRPPLKPFGDMGRLTSGVSKIFRQMDPELGQQFEMMVDEGRLDLENRKNKRPGGYCITYAAAKRPFIFANVVGVHDDVQTLLHESGHAFHALAAARLPYVQQSEAPMEFNEVASMAMELLASSHLKEFYSPAEAGRALAEHLEGIVLFWPYMAVVDAFQHWAYGHPKEAVDPDACDQAWDELYCRFTKGVDFTGYEEVRRTGWQRKLHIFIHPFYYIEYGLAQLGAVQIWANSRKDPSGALACYKEALALGGTRPLPQLYAAAGAKFSFEAEILRQAVAEVEERIK